MSKIPRIGLFDSGLGGLTVVRSLETLDRQFEVVYLGDTARVPYGSKSQELIQKYSEQNALRLLKEHIDLLCIACHTASLAASDLIKSLSPIPVVDMIGPTLKALSRSHPSGTVALLGTRSTIQSGIYQKLITRYFPHLSMISLSCPLLAPLVEEGYIEGSLADAVVHETLAPLRPINCQTVILACTHFPLLLKALRKELGEDVTFIDASKVQAEEIAAHFPEAPVGPLILKCMVTANSDECARLGSRFIGHPVDFTACSVEP